jgi:hypothetical protein
MLFVGFEHKTYQHIFIVTERITLVVDESGACDGFERDIFDGDVVNLEHQMFKQRTCGIRMIVHLEHHVAGDVVNVF